MGRRYKVKRAPGHYVERDRRGRFKRWAEIHRSISVDKRRKVEQKRSESGFGHVQDYQR
ncbi:MAG: hypothetical protein K6T73_07850 [Candidatus Bathyarchaeota archaeon]|nr:hypothetical protein [Candidatus Bathyarchaeota archaeon]